MSAPKVYGFDTGFVRHYRGWSELRPEDLGNLWEHYVLNEIHGRSQRPRVHYWRDKRGHEVDFVLPRRNDQVDAIECKWSSRSYDAKNLRAFRHQDPKGENLVVATDLDRTFRETIGNLTVEFIGLADLAQRLA